METIKEKIYWCLRRRYVAWAQYHAPHKLADILYRDVFHRWINWKNPQTLNEKINWLAFYTDTSLWSTCTDKYAVREYVANKGLSDILVPIYGKWDRAEDIDFENLPQKFVLKTNNGNSDIIVVTDKDKLNKTEAIYKLKKAGAGKFIGSAQPHYLSIKKCYIAEKLLETNNPLGLIDYKVKVFNGVPYCIGTWANRMPMTNTGDFGLYDLEWNPLKSWIKDTKYRNVPIPKPKCLKQMIECAKILGQDFEQVRVDFYEVDDKLYFGELTFTSAAGRDDDYTNEALLEMGKQIKLDFSRKIIKKWDLTEYKSIYEASQASDQ